MKAAAPFARMLIESCEQLRDRALREGVASREALSAIWPRNLSTGEIPIRQCVGVNRLLQCALAGSELGVLDAPSKFLDAALADAPVRLEGTEFEAYPKSYRTLQLTEHVSFWALRAGDAGSATRARQIRGWIATHPGPAHPFREVSELEALPASLTDLPLDDIEFGFQQANSLRCEAISGEPLRLADLSSRDYVPMVLRTLGNETGIAPDVLRDCYSFAFCLALASVANELRGDA